MKILMKPVDMIAYFTKDGIPYPLRYKVDWEDCENTTIKVNKILWHEEENLAGNKMIVFSCQSTINGLEKRYELKYELESCKWFLFKI